MNRNVVIAGRILNIECNRHYSLFPELSSFRPSGPNIYDINFSLPFKFFVLIMEIKCPSPTCQRSWFSLERKLCRIQCGHMMCALCIRETKYGSSANERKFCAHCSAPVQETKPVDNRIHMYELITYLESTGFLYITSKWTNHWWWYGHHKRNTKDVGKNREMFCYLVSEILSISISSTKAKQSAVIRVDPKLSYLEIEKSFL